MIIRVTLHISYPTNYIAFVIVADALRNDGKLALSEVGKHVTERRD